MNVYWKGTDKTLMPLKASLEKSTGWKLVSANLLLAPMTWINFIDVFCP